MTLAITLFGIASAGCALDDQIEGEGHELESLPSELEVDSPERAMLANADGLEERELASADGPEIQPLTTYIIYHGSDYATCDGSHLNAHDIECDNHGVVAEGYDDGGFFQVYDDTGCGGAGKHGDGTNIYLFRLCENFVGCTAWYLC